MQSGSPPVLPDTSRTLLLTGARSSDGVRIRSALEPHNCGQRNTCRGKCRTGASRALIAMAQLQQRGTAFVIGSSTRTQPGACWL